MAEKIRINTSTLGNDAETIHQCIQKMKNSKANIEKSVQILDGMWDGTASEEFKSAIHTDLQLLDVQIQNLVKLFNYETRAKTKYESCERKVSDIVSSIKI